VRDFSRSELMRQKMDDVVFFSDDIHETLSGLVEICRKHRMLENLKRRSGVSSATIYYTIDQQKNPRLDTALALLNAMGYDLKVVRKNG